MGIGHFQNSANSWLARAAVVFAIAALGCEGAPSEMGEECELSGNEDDCVEGGICTEVVKPDQPPCTTPMMCPPIESYNVCMPLCTAEQACAAGTICKRVKGSWKGSCRPDPALMAGSAAGAGGTSP